MAPNRLLAQLEALVLRRTQEVEALTAQHGRLRATQAAARLAAANGSALLRLAELLAAQRAEGSGVTRAGGSPGAGTTADVGMGGSGPPAAAPHREQLSQLLQFVRARSGGGSCSGGEGVAAASAPHTAPAAADVTLPAPTLCWSPEYAAARSASEDLSTHSLRKSVNDCCILMALLER